MDKKYTVAAVIFGGISAAFPLNVYDTESLKFGAKLSADGLLSYYPGNDPGQTPGLLTEPYYWWEAGATFGALVDYFYYTGSMEYVDVTKKAILWQAGPKKDFRPPNQTAYEGNDDQIFWTLAAMSAAETGFPDDGETRWASLAQGVFDQQAKRWNSVDNSWCGGGLRWQINLFNQGWTYKNAITNGGFFQLGSRLGRYTGNQTYVAWAEKAWNWAESIGLIDSNYRISDGAYVETNCTKLMDMQWSYNYGVYLLGAATMWNITSDNKWRVRTEGILAATSIFFSVAANTTNVMFERVCETGINCNIHQLTFKAYLARWMAHTSQLAPFTADFVQEKLRASARAAALQCSGGFDGVTCGVKWTEAGWDGRPGLGPQISALEVIQGNLVGDAPELAKAGTNGLGSKNISIWAGGGQMGDNQSRLIARSDRVGAWILTVGMVAGLLSCIGFMA